MPFYRRGFLYLERKRVKSILLLMILLFVNSMILGTNMILHATENTEAAIQEKTKAKVVCEITDEKECITDSEAQKIQNLSNVSVVNRMGNQTAFLSEFIPVTVSKSEQADNQKVNLYSFDNLENDSPFSDQSYRLTEGSMITPSSAHKAVVHATFAEINGLKIGDEISFETDEGKTTTVQILGMFLSGNENRQAKSIDSVYRIENEIYIDNTAYLELVGDSGFYKMSVYGSNPELLESMAQEIQEILKGKAEITTSDILFQQMKAPLTQITRVVEFMRVLTVMTGTAIVSLLLCMWMRSRQREMAVFISMGERKIHIFFQALLESTVIFLLAVIGSCSLGIISADELQKVLLHSVSSEFTLHIALQLTDIARLLGMGGIVIMTAVLLSLLPVIHANPKDILSRMEG